MKRIYLILTGISLILLSSCAQRAQEAKGHQTVKIDTVVSADKQTFLQFPGKVKATAFVISEDLDTLSAYARR
jgi:hypothetical protein